jgi:myo-inositol-1(or 4)-monophosphatase
VKGLAEAVRAAGALALDYFKGTVKSWDKAPGDPVSEADLAVDKLLHQNLRALAPDAGWLSEESVVGRKPVPARRLWVVDPIDGTRAFVEKRPEFAVSVALVEDARPLAAAVFNPATGEFFEAEAGRGARLNGQRLRVSARDAVDGARLLSGTGSAKRLGWLNEAGQPARAAEVGRINSIAYRLCLVASARFDGVVSLGHKSDWDLAAADLIVAEAGGATTDAKGRPFLYNREGLRHPAVIAANPTLNARLREEIARLPKS